MTAIVKKQNVTVERNSVAAQEAETGRKIVIAIDGPAGAGKGTLATRLAKELNLAFLDTGALYRVVAMLMIDINGNPDRAEDVNFCIKAAMKYITPELLTRPELRKEEVAAMASKVAAVPEVRAALLEFQRDFAKNPPEGYSGVVLDGRDIGTVVCPDADIKLFVTADAETRAKRRTQEVMAKNGKADFDAILADMKTRDLRDSTRAVAPTKPAEDAIIVDTSAWGIEETFGNTLKKIRDNMASKSKAKAA